MNVDLFRFFSVFENIILVPDICRARHVLGKSPSGAVEPGHGGSLGKAGMPRNRRKDLIINFNLCYQAVPIQ
jgi:hypothetical protein